MSSRKYFILCFFSFLPRRQYTVVVVNLIMHFVSRIRVVAATKVTADLETTTASSPADANPIAQMVHQPTQV